MVIVINFVIDGFSWVDLVWLAALTVWLQVYKCPITANCPIAMSDYNYAELLVKNKAANAPITFEEIVTVMINTAVVLPRIYTHFQMTKFNHPNTGF